MIKIFFTFLILAPTVIWAQTNFTVQGHLSGPEASYKKVYYEYEANKKFVIDSADINKGDFLISGIAVGSDVNRYSLWLANSLQNGRHANMLTLFIQKNDQIKVNANGKLDNGVIVNSEESVAFMKVVHQIDSVRRSENFTDIVKNLVTRYPDSQMSLAAFSMWYHPFSAMAQYHPEQISVVTQIFNLFSARIKGTEKGLAASSYVEKVNHLAIGGTLPDFTAPDISGKVFKLSDFKGKYVFVDFWASWCTPCREEFPYMKKVYEKFKNKNFEIVGYSIDSNREKWVSALAEEKSAWINLSNLKGNHDPLSSTFDLLAIPANFLIGPDGKVIATFLRGDALENKLNQLIK